MGMFNSIMCQVALPIELPKEFVKQNTSTNSGAPSIVYQTKSIEPNSMDMFDIDSDGQLHKLCYEGEWVDGDGPDLWSSLGYFKHTKEWWEPRDLSGKVEFYNSYKHPDETFDTQFEFSYGWVEFAALFLRGRLVEPVSLITANEPKRYTPEEQAAREAEWAKSREETQARMIKNRLERPTHEQKLIDTIDAIVRQQRDEWHPDDWNESLYSIEQLIAEFRQQYDTYHRYEQ